MIQPRGITFTAISILVVIVLCLIAGQGIKNQQVTKHQRYDAWVKWTGNEQQLTYEEWILLDDYYRSQWRTNGN